MKNWLLSILVSTVLCLAGTWCQRQACEWFAARAARLQSAYEQGLKAGTVGYDLNPHPHPSAVYNEWQRGYAEGGTARHAVRCEAEQIKARAAYEQGLRAGRTGVGFNPHRDRYTPHACEWDRGYADGLIAAAESKQKTVPAVVGKFAD